jgi:hypothetical protein
MMDDKPFGKFIISAGIGMAVVIAFVLYGAQRLESHVGANVAPYLLFVVLGVCVIAVGFFNDRYKAKITVPVGIAGWVVVLVMLFFHSIQQH